MTDLIVNFTITPFAPVTAVGSGNQSYPILQFHHVQGGWIPGLQDIGDKAHRVGGNGSIIQSLGTIGATVSFPLQAAYFYNPAATAFAGAVEALKDQTVSVKDGWGRTLPRVLILNAIARPKALFGPTVLGQPITSLVYCVITCERQTDT